MTSPYQEALRYLKEVKQSEEPKTSYEKYLNWCEENKKHSLDVMQFYNVVGAFRNCSGLLTCVICGTVFYPNNISQFFCSVECRRQSKRKPKGYPDPIDPTAGNYPARGCKIEG